MTPADVLDLYLHRGSFETVLADEDEEQAVDRWVSRTQWGQEFWQIINQWMWNLRLEFGRADTGHDDARDGPGLFAGAGAFYASAR